MLLDTEHITGYGYLWVSRHRTDHRTDCWTQWTNSTVIVTWLGQIDFLIVSLHVLLRASYLTAIIIFNC